MARSQSARLDRKKFFADPIMVGAIAFLIIFLTLFILYPLVMLLADSKTAKSNYTLAPQFCKANKAKITTAAYVFGGKLAVQENVWNARVKSTQ